MTDIDAISLARRGDEDGFAHLYRRYHHFIFSHCLSVLRNREDAEDFTQETFLQLHRKIGTYRGESAFPTWLYRIAHNQMLMMLRKKRLSIQSLDEIEEATADPAESRMTFVPSTPAPDHATLIDIPRAVAKLTPLQRRVFQARFEEGLELLEIATSTHQTVPRIQHAQSAVRHSLREVLA